MTYQYMRSQTIKYLMKETKCDSNGNDIFHMALYLIICYMVCVISMA